MPDANGRIKGHGWSRNYEDAYERIFARIKAVEEAQCCGDADSGYPCLGCPAVPSEPDRDVAAGRDPDEEADRQAARDGYNPGR